MFKMKSYIFNLQEWNQNMQLQIFIQENITMRKKHVKPAKNNYICLVAVL